MGAIASPSHAFNEVEHDIRLRSVNDPIQGRLVRMKRGFGHDVSIASESRCDGVSGRKRILLVRWRVLSDVGVQNEYAHASIVRPQPTTGDGAKMTR